MGQAPKPTPKSAIAEKLANSRGPLNRLRARHFGLDYLTGKAPELALYFEPGDPHSHLALQALARFRPRVQTAVRIFVVPSPRAEAYPEHDRQRAFALDDAAYIAPAWGLQFDPYAQIPGDAARLLAARLLLACEDEQAFIEQEANLRTALFADDTTSLAALSEESACADDSDAQQQMADNDARRTRLGHYLPGMWQFNGEWFWGIDRLNHLASRLGDKNLLAGDGPLLDFDASKAHLPEMLKLPNSLEFYFSFRSPYSYLAAVEVQQRYRKWPLQLDIKPVLPMAMRGLPVPLEKRLYIVRDVKREADLLGIPFGRIADPIGAGAERCLNTFPLAGNTDQQLDFLVKAGTGIWSQGIDVATDEGLAYVCDNSGIDWASAAQKLATGIDLSYAEANRQAMFDAGFWGVPTFRIGSFATWGRDRIWMIEEILRRLTLA